jgi:hypothetical protein
MSFVLYFGKDTTLRQRLVSASVEGVEAWVRMMSLLWARVWVRKCKFELREEVNVHGGKNQSDP